MRKITFVSGLYYYTRNGFSNYPQKSIDEMKLSIKHNPWYKDQLVCYADTPEMANILSENGLYIHGVFDNAPKEIIENAAHKMKHWFMYMAAKEFGDVIWLDWDTYNLKPIDNMFFDKCLNNKNPKFTYIPNYWATVNCSIYYLNVNYIGLMEESFHSIVETPNDELLWKSVLPKDIVDRDEYWLKDNVINIWTETDLNQIKENTYFIHLRDFQMLNLLKLKK